MQLGHKGRPQDAREAAAHCHRAAGVFLLPIQYLSCFQGDVRTAGLAARAERAEADRVARKVYWGLLPLLTIMGVFIYLDRSNLSFISGQIIPALGLTSTDYGLGSGAHPLRFTLRISTMCPLFSPTSWVALHLGPFVAAARASESHVRYVRYGANACEQTANAGPTPVSALLVAEV